MWDRRKADGRWGASAATFALPTVSISLISYRRQSFGVGGVIEAVQDGIDKLDIVDIKLIDTVDALAGAYLEVREQRFDRNGIRQLYENEAFPLRRLKVAS